MSMNAKAPNAARELIKSFRALHEHVRIIIVSKMKITEDELHYELKELNISAHERLRRCVAVETLKKEMACFQATLLASFPDRKVGMTLNWTLYAHPQYALEIDGRRVMEGGKGAIEDLLRTFAVETDGARHDASPRARRVVIPRLNEDWLNDIRVGQTVMGCLTDGFRSLDLWNGVSVNEAAALFESKYRSRNNRDFLGPVVAMGIADGPGTILHGDRDMPGCLNAGSPAASMVHGAVKEMEDRPGLAMLLETSLEAAMGEVLGARAVKSVQICVERQPGSDPQPWTFTSVQIEGGSRNKKQEIRDALEDLCDSIEVVLALMGSGDVVDGRIELSAERTRRYPIEKVGLRLVLAGCVCKYEMNFLGIMAGRFHSIPGCDAVKDDLCRMAAAVALCKFGSPGLYVAIHTSGVPWTARPIWAASEAHAAWLELDYYINDRFFGGDVEVAAYPLELDYISD